MNSLMQIQNLFSFGKVQTDSLNFKLHSKLTLAMFLLAALITSKGQFISDPIHCADIPGVSSKVVENFCWIHPTYSVTNAMTGQVGKDFAYPGIAPGSVADKRHVGYYQWVSLVLFLQAVMFAIPTLLWKRHSHKLIQTLIQNLNVQAPVSDPEQKSRELDRLAQYWADRRGTHGGLAFTYLACEALNLANVVGQLYLTNTFLGDNSFMSFGYKVIENSMQPPENRADPMNDVFPKMTKCDFWKYGKSGVIETFDTLCILPVNVINEKVYIVIWFWLICLSTLTSMYMVYLLAVIFLPNYRVQTILSKVAVPVRLAWVEAAVLTAKLNPLRQLGDWLVLNMIMSNLDLWTNGEVIQRIESLNLE